MQHSRVEHSLKSGISIWGIPRGIPRYMARIIVFIVVASWFVGCGNENAEESLANRLLDALEFKDDNLLVTTREGLAPEEHAGNPDYLQFFPLQEGTVCNRYDDIDIVSGLPAPLYFCLMDCDTAPGLVVHAESPEHHGAEKYIYVDLTNAGCRSMGPLEYESIHYMLLDDPEFIDHEFVLKFALAREGDGAVGNYFRWRFLVVAEN